MTVGAVFLTSVISRFKEYKTLGDKTFAQLNDAEMLFRPNEVSNSIGVIIQHMHGNMLSRWTNFLSEDGEKPWRRRDEEFEEQHFSRQKLLQLWEEGWQVLLQALEALQEQDLLKTITIRTQPLSVVDAINRQLAHYSSHVGQIVYIGRQVKSGSWQSLSINKGASQQFNEQMERSRH